MLNCSHLFKHQYAFLIGAVGTETESSIFGRVLVTDVGQQCVLYLLFIVEIQTANAKEAQYFPL